MFCRDFSRWTLRPTSRVQSFCNPDAWSWMAAYSPSWDRMGLRSAARPPVRLSSGRRAALAVDTRPCTSMGREGRAALSAAKELATERADGHADAAEAARFHVALVLIHTCDQVEEFRPRHAGEPLRVAARADLSLIHISEPPRPY